MISYVRGIIDHKEPDHVIVDVNGIGYKVFIPLSTYEKLPPVGSQVKLNTYHHVREDSINLYGFLTMEEKDTFEMLLSVSGVGTKVALGILSAVSVGEFRRAIAQANMEFLVKLPGIGKKTAERILLELKDKIDKAKIEEHIIVLAKSDLNNDAVAALMSLGASQSLAEYAVYRAERLLGKDAKLEDIIAQAIRTLSG